MRNATLLYNTTHTDKHAVQYVNFVSFPYLRLPALHCIKLRDTTLRCTTLHFTALQSIALHWGALHPSVRPSLHPSNSSNQSILIYVSSLLDLSNLSDLSYPSIHLSKLCISDMHLSYVSKLRIITYLCVDVSMYLCLRIYASIPSLSLSFSFSSSLCLSTDQSTKPSIYLPIHLYITYFRLIHLPTYLRTSLSI